MLIVSDPLKIVRYNLERLLWHTYSEHWTQCASPFPILYPA